MASQAHNNRYTKTSSVDNNTNPVAISLAQLTTYMYYMQGWGFRRSVLPSKSLLYCFGVFEAMHVALQWIQLKGHLAFSFVLDL